MNESRVTKKEKNQNIQVFVRVRPPNNAEKNGKSVTVIEVPSAKEVIVREKPQDKHSKKFTFDKVFGPTSRQVHVYHAVVSPLLEEVLAGYNCTVFAYGQTGTGKTFTMEGVNNDPSLHWENDSNAGIIPRSLSHLFDELRTLEAQEYSVRVSFLELYNEELFDLLSPTDDASKIRLYEDASKKGAVIIHGLEEVTVHTKSEVYKILEKGSEKRQTAATLMNAHSSRSHTVFSITVHIKENTVDGEELLKTGKLNLVDLAGSENVGRSGAVDRRAREAGNINQSLLTLGRVITALVERAPHIPYRESKLTRLLQESLGGRTKTSIIATVSPAGINLEETLSTLDYAHRAKNITNRPELNQKLSKKELLKEYTEEIERLRRDLLATRERNGVYIAQENYNDMQARIDCQEKDIADKINHIKALQEEMIKKDEIFNELQTNCELHLSDLNRTKSVLSNTEDSLKITETRLIMTQQERDEHKHLVEKHATTEKILSSQARKLLRVADVATSDAQKLHDKICRKTQVELENETLGQQFQRDMTNRVEDIEKDCSEYTQNLVQFCMSMKDDIAAQIATQSRGFDTTIQYISRDLVRRQTTATKCLSENAECSFNRSQAWSQELVHNLTTVADEEDKHLHETSVMLAPNIEALVNTQVEKNLKMLREDMMDKLGKLSTYFESNLDDICSRLAIGKAQVSNNCAKVKEHIGLIQTKQNYIMQNNQSLDKAFEQLSKQYIATKLSNEEHQRDIANILTEINITEDNAITDVTEFCESNTKNQRCHGDGMKKQITTVKNNVQKSIDENLSILNTAATRGKEFINQLTTRIQDRSRAWLNHRDTLERNMLKLQESAQNDKQHILSNAQELQSIVTDASVNHEEFMESQRYKMQQAHVELQQKLEEQGIGATQWGTEVTAKLRTTYHQVVKFLAEDLRRDIPTGGTPVRKEHQYPRELAATSPHDRIIQRFRSAMNEAVSDNESDNKENSENEAKKSVDILQKQMISKLKTSTSIDRRVLGSHN